MHNKKHLEPQEDNQHITQNKTHCRKPIPQAMRHVRFLEPLELIYRKNKAQNKQNLSLMYCLNEPKMKTPNIPIEKSWKEALEAEFTKPYFLGLTAFLASRKREGAVIYPPEPEIFNAYNLTPFDKVKVVVFGQKL